ncbi:Phosphoenolpyruvate/pyruvate domain-containing protein [Meredithblackwellia eburnea MCA 4105]
MSYGGHAVTRNGASEQLGLHAHFARQKAANKPVVGSWQMFPGTAIARTIAQGGFDFILVDAEHGNISDHHVHDAVNVIAAHGCSPVVRITQPDVGLVKRALDTGAHGIMCPMMNNAAEARALVSFAKFPIPAARLAADPTLVTGLRGVGSPFAPAVFGQSLPDYITTANKNTMVIVQIETADGVKNCDEIAAVPGIDMLFIGPNDLASQMGFVAGDHEKIPEVQEAIADVLAACKKHGKYAGMFCTSADQIRKRHEQGFDFCNLGFDVLALGAWNAQELSKIQDLR